MLHCMGKLMEVDHSVLTVQIDLILVELVCPQGSSAHRHVGNRNTKIFSSFPKRWQFLRSVVNHWYRLTIGILNSEYRYRAKTSNKNLFFLHASIRIFHRYLLGAWSEDMDCPAPLLDKAIDGVPLLESSCVSCAVCVHQHLIADTPLVRRNSNLALSPANDAPRHSLWHFALLIHLKQSIYGFLIQIVIVLFHKTHPFLLTSKFSCWPPNDLPPLCPETPCFHPDLLEGYKALCQSG